MPDFLKDVGQKLCSLPLSCTSGLHIILFFKYVIEGWIFISVKHHL